MIEWHRVVDESDLPPIGEWVLTYRPRSGQHYIKQARGLTPREAARVQGFPDDYLFLGSPNEWYRQIGNAVSPLMARVLGNGLKKVLERIEQP